MPASSSSSSGRSSRGSSKPAATRTKRASNSAGEAARSGDGVASLTEQLVNYVIKPLGLVMLTRERIQETLDEAAERGRLTRSDANELVAELVRRGRVQTDELLSDLERMLSRGRGQLGSAWGGSVERIVRTADRARRTVGVGPSFPILGYDELTAAQVDARLKGLTAAELRRVREYERRHANRKSVLESIERALG